MIFDDDIPNRLICPEYTPTKRLTWMGVIGEAQLHVVTALAGGAVCACLVFVLATVWYLSAITTLAMVIAVFSAVFFAIWAFTLNMFLLQKNQKERLRVFWLPTAFGAMCSLLFGSYIPIFISVCVVSLVVEYRFQNKKNTPPPPPDSGGRKKHPKGASFYIVRASFILNSPIFVLRRF
jgi:hypothetical protein